MSRLDIDALRLPYVQKAEVNDLIDAQLAKAAYGFADWLEDRWAETKGAELGRFMDDYVEALEQANIERPTVAPRTDR